MEISQDEFHQNQTCEPGAVAGCIEYGTEDSKFTSESPIVVAGGIDACTVTSLVYGTPTDLLNCSVAGNFNRTFDEDRIRGHAVTNDSGFPVPTKSTSPLTISEADLADEKSQEQDQSLTPLVNANESSHGNLDTAAVNFNAIGDEEGSKEFPVPSKSASPSTISEVDLSKSGTVMETNGLSEAKSQQNDDGDITEQKLTPLVNDNEDVENTHGNLSDTAAKNSLSRERKKSKYLCYPFVNLGKESKALPLLQSEIEDYNGPGNDFIQDENTFLLVKCGKRKREPRKSLDNLVKLELITSSSAELLLQLQSVARNHLNFYSDSSFDPVELLFKSFRVSVFRGLSDSELIGTLDEGNPNYDVLIENRNEEPVTEEKRVSSLGSELPADSNPKPQRRVPQRKRKNINTQGEPVSPIPSDSNPRPKRERKKKNTTISSSEYNPAKKKKTVKKDTRPKIPYINGNNAKPITLEVCLQEEATHEKTSSADVTIDQMRQSLELMTSMLGESSGSISPETRANLEKEIRKLLKKVNPMASST